MEKRVYQFKTLAEIFIFKVTIYRTPFLQILALISTMSTMWRKLYLEELPDSSCQSCGRRRGH